MGGLRACLEFSTPRRCQSCTVVCREWQKKELGVSLWMHLIGHFLGSRVTAAHVGSCMVASRCFSFPHPRVLRELFMQEGKNQFKGRCQQ